MCADSVLIVFYFLDGSSSNLSIYFQLPQNICMGLAEIFATVASLEFAYLAAPRSAQSLLMSLQFCSVGISSFLGKGYLSIYSTTSSSFDFSVSMKKCICYVLLY
jgi:dipeptide/tripeptide permease